MSRVVPHAAAQPDDEAGADERYRLQDDRADDPPAINAERQANADCW